jgi:hypothetical protein
MKRTKLTDFILQNLRWTWIFLWKQIYFSRLEKVLDEFKSNSDIENISHENNDVIKSFSKEVLGDRILYKIKVF